MAAQMAGFEADKAMRLTNAQREGAADLFTSARAEPEDMNAALRWAREHAGQIIDPHTAIGLHAALTSDIDPAVPMVTLATAHPAKFSNAVERATGVRPQLPTRIGDLMSREEAYSELPGKYDAVRSFIEERASLSNGGPSEVGPSA